MVFSPVSGSWLKRHPQMVLPGLQNGHCGCVGCVGGGCFRVFSGVGGVEGGGGGAIAWMDHRGGKPVACGKRERLPPHTPPNNMRHPLSPIFIPQIHSQPHPPPDGNMSHPPQ
jgi:hypothetical protein